MLGGLRVVLFAMLVWGNFSFAAISADSDERQALQTISSWMAHLNHFYPELEVQPAAGADLKNPQVLQQMWQDLEALEDLMHGSATLSNASFKVLACGRPQCNGGGGGGGCSTCK